LLLPSSKKSKRGEGGGGKKREEQVYLYFSFPSSASPSFKAGEGEREKKTSPDSIAASCANCPTDLPRRERKGGEGEKKEKNHLQLEAFCAIQEKRGKERRRKGRGGIIVIPEHVPH